MVPKHIHHAYLGNAYLEKIGSLRHAGTDQQASVGTAHNGKVLRRCIFFADQELCGSNEIVEHMLFLFLDAGFVPFCAILPATANVSHSINATISQENSPADAEIRRHADVETAIAI